MRILGIGTDIVEIARIDRLLERQAERFIERILHPHELAYLAQIHQPAAWLAKRFATKEAVAKALGTGIGQAASFVEIETRHTELGQPIIHLHGTSLATAKQLGVTSIQVSIADEREYAVAFVILLG
ncbi:holo-[acyl-carrier protein] synthase [Thiothrix eikelboomii]|uniref:Holo-[acyl-carrier-protein] synthase n=1 Tax=Thiothrix eikelboomii TaxID=92487 RepID=A0A1T4W3K9_9GAMM|nr:holo-ACP synthase [Thiothrix eikelboomii]SKA71803.1 holo-[acyl-carrier protein] synthase [Thiothrix eikelboomii]